MYLLKLDYLTKDVFQGHGMWHHVAEASSSIHTLPVMKLSRLWCPSTCCCQLEEKGPDQMLSRDSAQYPNLFRMQRHFLEETWMFTTPHPSF